MSSVIYSDDRFERATATAFLEKRIEINRAYASADFDAWLLERLSVRSGEDILDVGCGSGAQTVPFATLVGLTGSVSALDISAEFDFSIEEPGTAASAGAGGRGGNGRFGRRDRQRL